MNKYLVAGFGALTIAAMTTASANAQWRRPANTVVVVPHHGWNGHGWNGAGVAWGALGAFPPAYYPPPVVYARPPIVYAPYGYWRRY